MGALYTGTSGGLLVGEIIGTGRKWVTVERVFRERIPATLVAGMFPDLESALWARREAQAFLDVGDLIGAKAAIKNAPGYQPLR